MRVSQESLELLRAAIAPLDTARARDAYRTGRYPRARLTRDIDKRYRWDLFYALPTETHYAFYDANPDIHDSHIDTALRAIVAPL